MKDVRSRLVLLSMLGISSMPAQAERILDVNYFDDVGHFKLTFNYDGEGNEISMSKGGLRVMPEIEYVHQGLERTRIAYWARDSNDKFEDLLEQFASAPIYVILGGSREDYTILEFDPPVSDFGFWIFQNTINPRPEFFAYDANNKLIESAKFDNDAIDGTIKIGGGTVEYGFIGIAADREISRIELPTGPVAFDDLYYTPEPSAALLLLLAGAGVLRRR